MLGILDKNRSAVSDGLGYHVEAWYVNHVYLRKSNMEHPAVSLWLISLLKSVCYYWTSQGYTLGTGPLP